MDAQAICFCQRFYCPYTCLTCVLYIVFVPIPIDVKLDDIFAESESDTPPLSVVATPVHSPAKLQHPDYDKAFAVLNNPKSVTDDDILQRVLISLGVSEAEDLAHLDDDDLRIIFNHLKKISLKKFKRFLCRAMM